MSFCNKTNNTKHNNFVNAFIVSTNNKTTADSRLRPRCMRTRTEYFRSLLLRKNWLGYRLSFLPCSISG